MLKYMTKAEFKNIVAEYRFLVSSKTATKFDVMVITKGSENRFGVHHVVNPATKSGLWTQGGGGYGKAFACLEQIACYVDDHAEDKEDGQESCYKFLLSHQNYNSI